MGQTKTKVITGKDGALMSENAPSTENEGKTSTRKPKVRGKKILESKKQIDRAKLYPLPEAVSLAKNTDIANFNSTLEMHLVVKKEGLTTNVVLPHSTGSEKRIEVANADTVKKLESGKIDFDILLATGDMMPRLVPFAKILGPKGLMPNPKNGTLIKSEADAKKFSADKLNIKTEKKIPLIHVAFGKKNMSDSDLTENAQAIIDAVNKRQIVKCYIAATMSPSVKVAVE